MTYTKQSAVPFTLLPLLVGLNQHFLIFYSHNMSWADQKIKAYRNGSAATFFEKRNLEHANPLLFTLIVIAMIIASWGLWVHSWTAIVSAALLASLGHIYVWTRK